MYSVKTFDLVAVNRWTFDVIGTEVRCISSTNDFLIQLDDGQPIPFGVSRSFVATRNDGTPLPFKKVTVIPDPSAPPIGNPTGALLIGFAEYKDGRVGIAQNQQILTQPFSRMVASNDGVIGNAVPLGIGTGGGALPRALFVKNKDAAFPVYLSTDAAALLASATAGFQLDAGEGAYLPVSGTMYARHPAAGVTVQINVTSFYV